MNTNRTNTDPAAHAVSHCSRVELAIAALYNTARTDWDSTENPYPVGQLTILLHRDDKIIDAIEELANATKTDLSLIFEAAKEMRA